MLKKGAEAATKLIFPFGQVRTYMAGLPFKRAMEIPLAKLAVGNAKYQPPEDCEPHHRKLFVETVEKIVSAKESSAPIPSQQEDRPVSKILDALESLRSFAFSAPQSDEPEQSVDAVKVDSVDQDATLLDLSSLKNAVIHGASSEDIERKTDITAETIADTVERHGIALLRLHGVGEGYSTHHLRLILGTFEVDGKQHALFVDCNNMAKNPITKAIKEDGIEPAYFHELSNADAELYDVKKSVLGAACLEPMLEHAKEAYDKNREKYGKKEKVLEPVMISLSDKFIENLSESAKKLLFIDKAKMKEFAKAIKTQPEYIEYSDKWMQAQNQNRGGRVR